MSDFIEYATFAFTVLGGLFASYKYVEKLFTASTEAQTAQFQALSKSQLEQFTELKDTQKQNHHETDIRLTRIDSTMGPWGPEIIELKANQQTNVIDITELKAMEPRILNLERQVEALQNANRK